MALPGAELQRVRRYKALLLARRTDELLEELRKHELAALAPVPTVEGRPSLPLFPRLRPQVKPLRPTDPVTACPMDCTGVTVALCLYRQGKNEQKTGVVNGTKRRGQGGKSSTAKKRGASHAFPGCTKDCPVGSKIRALATLGPSTPTKRGR